MHSWCKIAPLSWTLCDSRSICWMLYERNLVKQGTQSPKVARVDNVLRESESAVCRPINEFKRFKGLSVQLESL